MFKKVLIALVAAMVSGSALAGGKLSVKPLYDVETEEVKYNVGLSVYQKMVGNLAYVGWLGGGIHPETNHVEDWVKTEQGVETYWGPLTLGTGLYYKWTPKTEEGLTTVYANIGLKLW